MLPTELSGAWRLVSWEDRDSEDDPWERPLGAGFAGQAMFDAGGAVSVHVHAPNSAGPRYLGYFGTAVVHDVERGDGGMRGTLLISVDGGHPPEAIEGDEPRPFEVRRDELILGDQRTWRRTCARIS